MLSRQNMLPYAINTYGNPYLHIHRADYHKILAQEAHGLGVSIQLGSTGTAVNFGIPAIHIKGKLGFRADIVVGADGLKSVCREALLGHTYPPKLTGDLVCRIIVKAEDVVKHENLRELVNNPAINYWMGPNAHAVCHLLKGGGLYNIVLACPDNLPELVNTQAADIQEIRGFFTK